MPREKSLIYHLDNLKLETRMHKPVHFTTWDMGGSCQFRPFYLHYFQNIDALVYVIDSNDRERFVSLNVESSYIFQYE